MEIDIQFTLFHLVGGLGIFLFGINLMGDSLKSLAGDKMKTIIEKLTNNKFKGILVGIFVTALIQSSSGTTALTISLIRSGLMTLPQAVGIIMGANVGTTVTAFLIGLKIKNYALPIIALGALLIFFFKKKKAQLIGSTILGFGMLFYGLKLMGSGLKPLAELPEFTNFMLRLSDNPLLGVFAGSALTVIVQSSSATIGILEELYAQNLIQIEAALPVLFGDNIGTTITAVIAALGGSIAAKRASAFHVLFNVIGTAIFLTLFIIFKKPVIDFIVYAETNFLSGFVEEGLVKPHLTIAFAHMFFNIMNTFILVWFANHLVRLVKIIVPGEDDDVEGDFSDDIFNDRLIEESPVIALEGAKKAIIHMANVTNKMFDQTIEYSKKNSDKLLENTLQLEQIINTLDRKTHDYLVKLSSEILPGEQSQILNKYIDTIRDLERIGDHCENILELYEHKYAHKGIFTEQAQKELDTLFTITKKMFSDSIKTFIDDDKVIAEQVIKIEDEVDRLEKKTRKRHTLRVKEGVCTSDTLTNFVDILSNLERIGDHCCNIAEYTLYDHYYMLDDEDQVMSY